MSLVPKQVEESEVIFVSHSGGKDSQAMLAQLVRLGLKEKIVLVHADLGEMEWEEMKPWIESNSFGLKCHVVESEYSFFSLVEKYGRLPSGQQQFCTDFLKIKPIGAFIHDYMTEHGITRAINATGMRAEESKRRAGKLPLTLSKGKGATGLYQPRKYPTHLIHDWLPILGYTESEVFEEIRLAGQEVHKVYGMGFSRLSCVFCVNGRIGEHKEATKLRPELAKKMSQLERKIGKTLRLKQVKGVKYPKFMDEYLPVN